MPRDDDVTGLLVAWGRGDRAADSRLIGARVRRPAAGRAPAAASRTERPLAGPDRARPRGLPAARRLEARALAEPRTLLRDRRPRHAPDPGGPCARARGRQARWRRLEGPVGNRMPEPPSPRTFTSSTLRPRWRSSRRSTRAWATSSWCDSSEDSPSKRRERPSTCRRPPSSATGHGPARSCSASFDPGEHKLKVYVVRRFDLICCM